MAQVITYSCDITGKSSTDKNDFVTVSIKANGNFTNNPSHYCNDYYNVSKLVHKDVAVKLGFKEPAKDVVVPEITFEDKVKALMTDIYENYFAEMVSDQISDEIRHRG